MKKLLVILLMFAAMSVNAQWQPDVRLTNASGNSFTSYNNSWCVAANVNAVHTVWYDYRDGNWEIYYKRSTDGGIIWETDTRLTNDSAISYASSIAVSGSAVHVIWHDNRDGNNEIYYKHSTDAGITWGMDKRLTTNTAMSWGPSIAVSSSVVHVVWNDNRDGNEEIYYKRSNDGGITWGTDTRLTNNPSESHSPSIAVFGSVVQVAWSDGREGNQNTEIYYKRSTDSGITWGADTRLTNNSNFSFAPSITVSNLNVHIVWSDYRDNNFEIYYKRSTDGGINWGVDTRLTNYPFTSASSSIVISGLNVHLVWNEEHDGNWEIYYKRSTDNGISWEADSRITNNIDDSGGPSVAVSGSIVHVVWNDYRDSITTEIYYKRNPTGNPVGIKNISTETPSKYSLSQNYPNPFNPITNFKFSMLNARDVKLVVYDVQGREVQTLVNEKLSAGTYEVKFDGSMLNSGVYFYKLITDGFTETKKMLMIK